ncbi:MAG TPA: FAD-dependent monooxygenase, partial [Saprospiraceae bacterium]|nr:FAD-dependent monooxygenase [Saprospiraceae bacterium]
MKEKSAIVVGAGLVGSLWAIYLAKAGYKVDVYEMRGDIRKADIAAGKSINLALSDRGWRALDRVGVGDEIRKIAIPMYGRIMHSLGGELTFQPYGKEDQAIYSVSRGEVNALLMEAAEKEGEVNIHYFHKCTGADTTKGIAHFENTKTGANLSAQADLIFGTDGAFSAVRYKAMQKLNRFNYEQRYISDGYREILLPANADGTHRLDKNALHIWPRGKFMLIALANEDGSFTCTLFMPFEGEENSFEQLQSSSQINHFFKNTFPDFFELMPNIATEWGGHPLSSLAIIRCFPWANGTTLLLGDAAHATVPFYGQGMNSGFEDCRILGEMMEEYRENWPVIFEQFQQERKANGDAVQDLSLHNYYVMRDFVGDPKFLLQKKIEADFSAKHPDKWMPLYSQVTFSHIPYSEALTIGMRQDRIIKEVMEEV